MLNYNFFNYPGMQLSNHKGQESRQLMKYCNAVYKPLEYKFVVENEFVYFKNTGNYWGCFWLTAWWGVWDVLNLMGKKGSELRCSECSQDWNVLDKDLLPAALIVG